MNGLNRRQVLLRGGAFAACAGVALHTGVAAALPLGLPLGLQLYSVRELLPKDYLGTLQQIAALGYTEVESAGYFGHSPAEVKAAMAQAGLHLVSSHSSAGDLMKDFDGTLAFAKAVGVRYLICSFPAIQDPSRLKDKSFKGQVEAFTLEDFRWNAEKFNEWGRKTRAAGIQFGYHNHTMEFAPKKGVVPFDEMIRLTDPALVTFEMDCGWVEVGGGDPVAYLHKYPQRISMLHVKDFKPGPGSVTDPPAAADLGQGRVNFRSIFEAAKGTAVRHYFVEQENFDEPPMQALRTDADFMKKLRV